ncbi:prolyl 4-hydroxylase alpha subunit-like protein [Haematococcus lacustris]
MPGMTRFILLTLIASLAAASKPERWGGLPETIDVGRSISLNTEPGLPFDESHSPWVEQVGLHPKVYVFHNFLTPMERAHMVRVAAPQMRRSTVVGPGGESVIDEIRTSYGMFIRRCSDPIIERIERRISLYTHIPMSHQEDIQVLRYTNNQSYGAHFDSGDKSEPGPHQRLATFLMYLSDVEEGGETAFPQGSKWIDPSIPRKLEEAGVKLSACAQGHVAYKPKAGDAVLFYSFHPNGSMDMASMHTGCPVLKGIKWAAPVWIHTDQFNSADWEYLQRAKPNRVEYPAEPGQCDDAHPQCKQWAAAGECAKNHGYMMGDAGGGGACRKSCGACRVCSGSSDLSCINDNRSKAGYLPLVRSEMEWLGVPWWLGEEPSPEL